MFFFGTFEHSIDDRGRVAIPARYRPAFDTGGVLRDGPEGCVEMYTSAGFDDAIQRRLGAEGAGSNIGRGGRRIRRAFLPSAFAVELDRQGRVLVPQPLRQAASLGKDYVVVIGCGDYLEIWSPDAWQAELGKLAAESEAGVDGPASMSQSPAGG